MKKVNTKFGTIYVEDYEFDRHDQNEDRIQIFDSNERYLDYFSIETIETKKDYDDLIETFMKIKTLEGFLDYICLDYDLVSKDRKEIVEYLIGTNVDDDSDIEENDWVNKIGDNYIVVSEF